MPGYDWKFKSGSGSSSSDSSQTNHHTGTSSGSGSSASIGQTIHNVSNQNQNQNQHQYHYSYYPKPNQNQDVKPKDVKPKEHKLLTQFKKLVAEGKGNTSQAQVLANYLHGVETKAQSQGSSIWNTGAPEQIDYSTMDFPEYDMDAPMATGYGSWFGDYSLSTGSSQSIQNTYKMIADKLVSEQGYHPDVAAKIAADTIMPGFSAFAAGQGPAPFNLMDIPEGHTGLESKYVNEQMPWMGGVPHYNYGGGWGSGWGSGGGGGGSGGSGFGYSTHDPMQQGYQRAQVGPGSLQEQVNQIYLGMGNLNAAPGFNKNRGGIVSLVQ
tara:strand:+ start:200 stop:1168 length:969 start_codon:yes stop_codon:yes gene_type:complete